MNVVIFIYQLLIQYETDNGEVGKLYGDQQTARECYTNNFKGMGDPGERPKNRKREDIEDNHY